MEEPGFSTIDCPEGANGLSDIVLNVILNEFPLTKECSSLPSNLDEAVERMASDIAPDYPDISWDTCYKKIKEGIKAGVEWMAGQFQKIEGGLLDWYETNGVDYCNGISTNESFEVPEGFYIKKK